MKIVVRLFTVRYMYMSKNRVAVTTFVIHMVASGIGHSVKV